MQQMRLCRRLHLALKIRAGRGGGQGKSSADFSQRLTKPRDPVLFQIGWGHFHRQFGTGAIRYRVNS